jgi:hypothetical protein
VYVSKSTSDLKFSSESKTDELPSSTQKEMNRIQHIQIIMFFSLVLSAIFGLSVGLATRNFNTGFAIGTGSLEILRAIRELIWVEKGPRATESRC